MKNAFLIFFLLTGFLKAQTNIEGRVLDSLYQPVPYSPVALLKLKDSIIFKGTVTNDSGYYKFTTIPSGEYLIKVLALGFKNKYSLPVIIDNQASILIEDLLLDGNGQNLDEVSVVTIRKPIEFKNGNVIVNIDGSPLAIGNTAFDLLVRLPGVTVINDEVSIQGNPGVRFYMDNRLLQVSGSQLMNLLKSMNASTIDKIEIMKNPPARYDASGNAGIINIITKKVKLVGFSGGANASFSQGFYGNPTFGGELKYKAKNFSLFSDLLLVDETYRKENSFKRIIEFNNNTSILNQNFVEQNNNKIYMANLGSDIYLSKRDILGCKFSISGGEGGYFRDGVIDVKNSDLGYDYSLYNFVKKNPWTYSNTNINYEHTFDTVGTKITLSCDYTNNSDLWDSKYINLFFYNNNSISIPSIIFNTNNKLILNVATAKVDFEKQLTQSIKLELGAKYTWQDMNSDFSFFQSNSVGIFVIDSALTNSFNYKEKVPALYTNIQKSFKKINLQIGMRGEHTIVNASGATTAYKFQKEYFNIFPVLSMDYNINNNNMLQLSYNRRIQRPDYNSFNPYRTFRNYMVYSVGNPDLMPTYLNSMNFGYMYKNFIGNSISLSRFDNVFYEYSFQNDSTKEYLTTTRNLKAKNGLSYSLFIQKSLLKFWSFSANASFNYFNFQGKIDSKDYNTTSYGYYVSCNNQFLIKEKGKIEINFFYIGPWLEGITYLNPRWSFDLAYKYSFLKDKLRLGISFGDIFFTNIVGSKIEFENQNTRTTSKNDTRRFRISLNWKFGKIRTSQRQISSNEDESNRVKK